jgi:hypothetical protein
MKGLGIASMVLGIVGIVFALTVCLAPIGVIVALVGVILGGVSLSKYKTAETQEGKGMATAGLVLCIITLAIAVIVWVTCYSTSAGLMEAIETYNP